MGDRESNGTRRLSGSRAELSWLRRPPPSPQELPWRHLRRYIARYSLAAAIYRQYYQRRRLAPDWLRKVQFWRASRCAKGIVARDSDGRSGCDQKILALTLERFGVAAASRVVAPLAVEGCSISSLSGWSVSAC